MHRLFQNLFPNGDSLPFINAIYRIFSHKQCNEYLDFQEFLTAMNVTTLRSEEEKLQVLLLYLHYSSLVFTDGCLKIIFCSHEIVTKALSYVIILSPTSNDREKARSIFLQILRKRHLLSFQR